MTEQELVKACLHDICRRNGFDDPTLMTQRDLDHLSNEIESATGTLISVSTIKRLLNGQFSRTPQTATLNAISTYLGFGSWQAYKNAAFKKDSPAKTPEMPAPAPKAATAGWRPGLKWLGGALVAAAIVVFFIRFMKRDPQPLTGSEKALFSAAKTTEKDIPNTVVFHYNVDAVNADSFFIQQSWDKRRRVRIYKNAYTLTDIYYEPGYHVAKLIANDSIIKTIDVSIPTDRWILYAEDPGHKGIPQYVLKSDFVSNGRLQPNKAMLDSSQINYAAEKTYVCAYFPSKRSVSSEHFRFTARVRVHPVRNNQCPYLMLEVYCQRYFMFFKSMPPGCASEASAMFGENYLSGKTVNLAPLCYEVQQWMDVEMAVDNKQVTISLNHVPVFSNSYRQPTGLVTGLGFISNGLCEVDAASLKGLDGKILY